MQTKFTWLFLVLAFTVNAQNEFEPNLKKDQALLNKKGMFVLGAWGLGNVGTGFAFMQSKDMEQKAFHQMNLGWGSVNLGLATLGWLQARASLHNPKNKPHQKPFYYKQVFMINTFLDVGYISTGLYLHTVADQSKRPEQLSGFGKSLVLQGAFLFLLDGFMYLQHRYLYKPHKHKTQSY